MVNGLFSYLFDVLLFENKMGYGYTYFSLIFFTLVLYFFYEKFGNNWFGLFSFGLSGLIGIPIEYWLEWRVNPVLKSPWFAVAWGGIYVLYGFGADLSYWVLKLKLNKTLTVVLSSAVFSLLFIIISIIPLELFYITPEPTEGTKTFLTFWHFLIPYGVIQGIIGAYSGMHLAKELSTKQESARITE